MVNHVILFPIILYFNWNFTKRSTENKRRVPLALSSEEYSRVLKLGARSLDKATEQYAQRFP